MSGLRGKGNKRMTKIKTLGEMKAEVRLWFLNHSYFNDPCNCGGPMPCLNNVLSIPNFEAYLGRHAPDCKHRLMQIDNLAVAKARAEEEVGR